MRNRIKRLLLKWAFKGIDRRTASWILASLTKEIEIKEEKVVIPPPGKKGKAEFLSDVTEQELEEMSRPGPLRRFLDKFVKPANEQEDGGNG